MICSPNSTHARFAQTPAKRERMFSARNRWAAHLKRPVRIAESASRNGVRSMVGYVYRWAPMVRYAQQLVAEGAIGEVTHYRGRFLVGYGKDPATPLSWRFDGDAAGFGALGDLMSPCAGHVPLHRREDQRGSVRHPHLHQGAPHPSPLRQPCLWRPGRRHQGSGHQRRLRNSSDPSSQRRSRSVVSPVGLPLASSRISHGCVDGMPLAVRSISSRSTTTTYVDTPRVGQRHSRLERCGKRVGRDRMAPRRAPAWCRRSIGSHRTSNLPGWQRWRIWGFRIRSVRRSQTRPTWRRPSCGCCQRLTSWRCAARPAVAAPRMRDRRVCRRVRSNRCRCAG